jgi:hypothetical protein
MTPSDVQPDIVDVSAEQAHAVQPFQAMDHEGVRSPCRSQEYSPSRDNPSPNSGITCE